MKSVALAPWTYAAGRVQDSDQARQQLDEGLPNRSWRKTFAVAASQRDSAQMSVQLDGQETYARTARIERLSEAELLATELDTTTVDNVFEQALGAAAAFLRSA